MQDRQTLICAGPFISCRHRNNILKMLPSFINSSVSNLPVYIIAKCLYAAVMVSVLTALSFGLLPWHLPQVLPCIISLVFCMEARWNMTAAPVVVLATIWKVCSAWHLS